MGKIWNFVKNSSLSFFTVMLWSAHSTFIELSKREGDFTYSPISAVVMTEALKLFMSVCLYFNSNGEQASLKDLRDNFVERGGFYFAVPGLIYMLYNNLVYVILLVVDAGTWRVMLNFRIIFTALLFQYFFKKTLSKEKWAALLMLTFGCMIQAKGSLQIGGIFALLMIFAQTATSALALVFNEFLLKKDVKCSVHAQNIYLYGFGTLFNIFVMLVKNPQAIYPEVFFKGFNWQLAPIIIISAFGGVLISLVLKYMDSVWKLFLDQLQMVMVTFIGVNFLNVPFELIQIPIILSVALSSYAYNYVDIKEQEALRLEKAATDSGKEMKVVVNAGDDDDEEAAKKPLVAKSETAAGASKSKEGQLGHKQAL